MKGTIARTGLLLAVVLAPLAAQRYNGPRPERVDVPFLLHARNLVETEVSEAKEATGKEEIVYTVGGATSGARTPLPEPIFLLKAEKIVPDKLQLYRMTVKGGQRTLTIPSGKKRRDGPQAIFLMVHRLEQGLFRVEVNEVIENGEYCLSPEGSNQVFCFTTY
jgi:hypothetical protein